MALNPYILLYCTIPLLGGWILDNLIGDPIKLPHPIVGFGKLIAFGDKRLNKGKYKKLKGGLYSILLIVGCFIIAYYILHEARLISPYFATILTTIGVFYCLAGKTLRNEVRMVFQAVDTSVEAGRKQLARIVGRDTSQLSPQSIRTAALETLAENLSDGVIAPLFWYAVLGLPGMLAYKMINTLDSMIAYKSEKYKDYGCWAAHIDDIANYIPARITALIMLIVSGRLDLISFIHKYHKKHLSPNSGFPESAMAGILGCQFGGPNIYHGVRVNKPFIGDTSKVLTLDDVQKAIRVNTKTELFSICLILLIYTLL